MSNVVERLKVQLAAMKSGAINASTVHRLLSLFRELIEQRGERKKYQILTFFCDCAAHFKLTRSKLGGELLDILDEVFAASQTVDLKIGELLSKISPRALQVQMFELLGSEFN